MIKWYTIKIVKTGAFHIVYKKTIEGVEFYVASNHRNKYRCDSDKIELIK